MISFSSEALFLAGLASGALLTYLLMRPSLKERREALDRQNLEIEQLRERSHELEKQLILLESEKENTALRLQEQEKNYVSLQQKLTAEFENLSHRIFQEKTHRFQEDSHKSLQQLLSPLKEKMDHFQKKIEDTHLHESQQRVLLQSEMQNIIQSNTIISQEANRLGKVLRGDVKVQGTWGEVVLEKVLESSGLRQGQEYTIQGKGIDLKGEIGNRLQPDVIIKLPENKHIVIDAKMSYVFYEKFAFAAEEEEKKEHLKKLVGSFYNHVDDLSGKNYQSLDGLKTPDFVLLFVPVEAIFSLIMQNEPQLFEYAWKRSIVIVSPVNLMAVLRTIDSLWKMERQNRNAQKIAEEAGKLYDKFADLLLDVDKLGDSLRRTDTYYQDIVHKIQGGRGNILKRIEDLKALGLKTTKQIPVKEMEEVGELPN